MNPYFIFSTDPLFCPVSCHAVSVIVTCCEVWTLGVWACHKRLFNLGTWCPAFVCMYVYVCVCVCVCLVVCLVFIFGWRVCVWWVGGWGGREGGWLWVLSRLPFYLL